MIYHVLTSSEWESASRKPQYTPAGFGADGFIHCCTGDQLVYVGDHYFRGQKDLVIVCIETDRLTAPVKYEDLHREGMVFAHIYGSLNTAAVQNVVVFPPNADGTFSLPAQIED